MTDVRLREIVGKQYKADKSKRAWPFDSAKLRAEEIVNESPSITGKKAFLREYGYEVLVFGLTEMAKKIIETAEEKARKTETDDQPDFAEVEETFGIRASLKKPRAIEPGPRPRRIAPEEFDRAMFVQYRTYLHSRRDAIDAGCIEVDQIEIEAGDYWDKNPKLKLPEILTQIDDDAA